MKRLLLVLLLFPFFSNAQVNLDSLWGVWNDPNQADTNRLKALGDICWDGYLYTKPDSAFILAQMEYDFAKTKRLKKYMAQALNMQGTSFYVNGDYNKAINYYTKSLEIREEMSDKQGAATLIGNIGLMYSSQGDITNALEYYTKSLKILKEIGDKKGIENLLNNIGSAYNEQGNHSKAIAYHMESLKIGEEIGDEQGVSMALNNIGNIYQAQNDYLKAIKYFERSLKIKKMLGDKWGTGISLNNIGNAYYKVGDFMKALEYHTQSLTIREEIGHKSGMALSLNNIGNIYLTQGAYRKALNYLTKSLKISEEIGYKNGMALSYGNISKSYIKQGDYSKGLEYATKSLKIAKEIGGIKEISGAAELLWEANKALGYSTEALEMYELYVSTRDSIKSEENQRAVIRQEYKYEYEKQAVADSLKSVEANKLKDAKLTAEHAENTRRKQQSYFLFGGLALALIFGGFIFNRYKVTSQQKEIISEQKEEVDKAYTELEGKNQKILDSITYAKRIQSAILPSAKVVKEYLHESFIIYLPKDVVAGDFYWLESFASVDSAKASDSKESKVFFAAADCTGHGVPGAMVSVVCNNGLNRSVREHGLTDPGKILDKTREIVVQEFEKSEEEVKDGMDIALCSLEGKTLKYAGAHNPLVIVRKGAEECEVIKPNKEPIGQFDNPKPYTTHKLELLEGDSIYLFSDGLQDQFGGPKGKKFMISRFKKLLVEVSKEPMDKQKELILRAFYDWKGNEEQVDDICIIGLRI